MAFDKISTQDTEHKLIQKARKMAYRDNRSFYLNIGIIGVFTGHIVVPLLLGVWLGGILEEKERAQSGRGCSFVVRLRKW